MTQKRIKNFRDILIRPLDDIPNHWAKIQVNKISTKMGSEKERLLSGA